MTLTNSDNSTESKGTLNITIQNDTGAGVPGAKITLKSKKDNTLYDSSLSGTLGGCKIEDLPYGQYEVSMTTTPTGYNTSTIDDITIDQAVNSLTVEITI